MNNSDSIEIRKIQALTGDRSFTIVLPKQFAIDLAIQKGDYVKVRQEKNRILIEKA